MRGTPELVRCVACRHEYELPVVGQHVGCPDCGAISWVSTRFVDATGATAAAGSESTAPPRG